jgi:hypothetical protein
VYDLLAEAYAVVVEHVTADPEDLRGAGKSMPAASVVQI